MFHICLIIHIIHIINSVNLTSFYIFFISLFLDNASSFIQFINDLFHLIILHKFLNAKQSLTLFFPNLITIDFFLLVGLETSVRDSRKWTQSAPSLEQKLFYRSLESCSHCPIPTGIFLITIRSFLWVNSIQNRSFLWTCSKFWCFYITF